MVVSHAAAPQFPSIAMASTKLPPRQKMINMMYLVLTAMLALNVSKEVLDSFAIMDAELVRSERAHEQRSRLEYAVFEEAARRFPDKFGAKHEQALRVKDMADALVEHIQGIKAGAMARADKLDPAALRGADVSGRDTLRALMALDAKDDRATLTRMLIGADPAAPHREGGGAYDLKLRVAAFRDSLIALCGAKATDLSAALHLLFDLGERRDASGRSTSWEATNFYDVPLAAGIATLSKLQADVRAAENDMVKWLYRSVEAADHKFGTLTAAVVPTSAWVMAGDSFRADVFLAAYEPTNPPRVELLGGQELPIGHDGKAKLRIRGDRPGEHRVEGRILFEGPEGAVELPYTTSYQVMTPVLVASPTKMNVLYRGVPNPLDISVPGVPHERIQASTSNGRIIRAGQGWEVVDVSPGSAEIFATVASPDGSTRRIGPMTFRVKDLPPPLVFVAGKSSKDNTVTKAELLAARGVNARLDDSPFDAPFTVKRFQLTVVRKEGNVYSFPVTGNRFTPEIRNALEQLRPNDRVIVEEVRARLSNNEGRDVDLAGVSLKVVR
jgi:gliding motility-associated protein GldM